MWTPEECFLIFIATALSVIPVPEPDSELVIIVI
jgi:hypothetical protein